MKVTFGHRSAGDAGKSKTYEEVSGRSFQAEETVRAEILWQAWECDNNRATFTLYPGNSYLWS